MSPFYDYECQGCGHVIEVFYKIDDRPELLPCSESCGGQMRQIMSPTMVQCEDIVNVPWIREFAHNHNRQGGKRNRQGGPPIESRSDYKKYLKDNDLRPARGENLSEV
jgi:putative FmdB family regulatory protein